MDKNTKVSHSFQTFADYNYVLNPVRRSDTELAGDTVPPAPQLRNSHRQTFLGSGPLLQPILRARQTLEEHATARTGHHARGKPSNPKLLSCPLASSEVATHRKVLQT